MTPFRTLYIDMNSFFASVVQQVDPLLRGRPLGITAVSADSTAELEGALALARKMKVAILGRVGSELRCSIGVGPNQLLAKIAGKLEKPDGLQWLAPENMPQAISHLQLDDLPGISRGIKRKPHRAMIWDVRALYALDPRHARQIWHSVEGERFVRALQGENIPLGTTQRNGYGNSKVLAPKYRQPKQAMLVGRRLVENQPSGCGGMRFAPAVLACRCGFSQKAGGPGRDPLRPRRIRRPFWVSICSYGASCYCDGQP